jgi:hypothetical protein
VFVHGEFGTESPAPFSTPVPWGRFSIPPLSLQSLLDYSLLFVFFSFVWEPSVCPGAMIDYVPRGWVGQLLMLCELFILQIHANSFGASWQGENALLFSVC